MFNKFISKNVVYEFMWKKKTYRCVSTATMVT